MNKYLVKLSALFLVPLCFCTFCACSSVKSSDSTTFPREVSVKEASSVLGVEIPQPTSLPKGYNITKITLEDYNAISFIVKKSNHPEIKIHIEWLEIPLKILNGTEIDINGNTGYFFDRIEDNMIKWNLLPSNQPTTNNGFFELTLLAEKEIPTGELILIAECMGW